MGLFNRKSSKLSPQGDNESSTSTGTRGSNPSLKSPPLSNTTNGAALSPGLVKLPDIALPRAPDPTLDPAAYLRSIHSVRERSRLVLRRAKKNQLTHFDVDLSKFKETAGYVCSIIKVRISSAPKAKDQGSEADESPRPQRDYAPDYKSVPPHGRWQHFEVGGRPRVDQLLASWPSQVDAQERTRRLIDLFLVSVLPDSLLL